MTLYSTARLPFRQQKFSQLMKNNLKNSIIIFPGNFILRIVYTTSSMQGHEKF